ncbi:hypothetical protein SCOR_26510 [Sulfidibacter corallicola]|uniref:Uncharacterized protein n=1 Tax=Sulfidibacter corallicola TaxID=2818388 RepID=A0A8A4TMW8_SULCO|nr:hypothetical protein [Sulfidibacter corallicola]QTD50893.1 hypothetical protein J3U87_00360 [Sulfidibacter corallicola]
MLWRYFADLSGVKIALWCYLIWYLNVLSRYFDADPKLWLTSLGISFIVGFANNLNAMTAGQKSLEKKRPSLWVAFRFFLAPFCVSSFAAMVKGQGFFLVFPPTFRENATGLAACLAFVALIMGSRYRKRHPPNAT